MTRTITKIRTTRTTMTTNDNHNTDNNNNNNSSDNDNNNNDNANNNNNDVKHKLVNKPGSKLFLHSLTSLRRFMEQWDP